MARIKRYSMFRHCAEYLQSKVNKWISNHVMTVRSIYCTVRHVAGGVACLMVSGSGHTVLQINGGQGIAHLFIYLLAGAPIVVKALAPLIPLIF